MSKIWVAGHGFDVDARVIRWDEGPGFNATLDQCIRPNKPCPSGIYPYALDVNNRRRNRYARRPALRGAGDNPSLSAAQAVIRQFIVHHDGCPSAKVCFEVLHNERGLSCHFLIDNDGTIYQTMDLALMAYHAAGFNANSVGVELCNRGNAKTDPHYYSRRRIQRGITTCRIHNHIYLAFEYTDAQHIAMRELAKGLARALPNLPIEYPQDAPGQQAWGEIPNARNFAGYMGHYHTTRRKWDPGPFDFKAFCESTRGGRAFPIYTPKTKTDPGRPPEVPTEHTALTAATDELYRANEEQARNGFFPVGPYGEWRLWHGGVHLATERGAPVFTPFPGRVMAVRTGGMSAVGSTGFVLMRHDMSVGKAPVRFFSLYFHLDDESGREADPDAPSWVRSEAWKRDQLRGRTVLLDEPVEGGEVIGRVGVGGPDDVRRPQLHFQVFSSDNVMAAIHAANTELLTNPWQFVDGSSMGRFCADPMINDAIDVDPRDGLLSRRELTDFFGAGPDRVLLRYYITLNLSEWIGRPDWWAELRRSPDFRDLGDDELAAMIEDQVTPTLWWTDEVARHARLPRDGVVYHYHPITFVKYINEKILEAAVDAEPTAPGAFDQRDADNPPEGVTDDIGDVSGESFVDESELVEHDLGHDLGLEDLVQGFPE
jgi:N-acetylmuramoyl-L-alanine amidase